MVLLITYDLHNPSRDYENVIETIKSARSWAHPQGSVWLIDSRIEPGDWIEKLKNAGDSDDEYFVSELKRNWSSINMGTKVVEWLKNTSRDW